MKLKFLVLVCLIAKAISSTSVGSLSAASVVAGTHSLKNGQKYSLDLASATLVNQNCEPGNHNNNKECIPNDEYCDEYDPQTKNCMKCDWYAWFVKNENQNDVKGDGNWCETRWWLWL